MELKDLIPFSRKDRTADLEQRNEHPLTVMQREMNRLFESFFSDLDGEPFLDRAIGFSPKINVAESGKELLITAELPGMDEKDIDVSITKDLLTIKGEKKMERTDGTLRSERAYGSFNRTVSLPREVDQEKVEAHMKQGVLTVKLPKTTQTLQETKKIQVTTK